MAAEREYLSYRNRDIIKQIDAVNNYLNGLASGSVFAAFASFWFCLRAFLWHKPSSRSFGKGGPFLLYLFHQIDNIHLLIMEPSSYDVELFANKQMTCRELEGELWDDYFGANINYSKGRVLAYHWKFENECSCLVKVKYSKTNVTAFLIYQAALDVFFFLIGLLLGRKK